MIEARPSYDSLDFRARSAVFDAVQTVPYYYLNGGSKDYRTLPQALSNDTEGQCIRASSHCLYLLQEKHSDLFNHLFLLSVTKNFAGWPYTRLKNAKYDSHSYFIAKAKGESELIYASSPANFRAGPLNPLTTIFENTDLNKVLASIEERDGGMWSTSERISELIATAYEPPIRLDPERVMVTEILVDSHKTTIQPKIVRLPNSKYSFGRLMFDAAGEA